jgi:hypothetical protein
MRKAARRRTGSGGHRQASYLGTAEVAAVLGVTTARVRQLALAGQLAEKLRVGGRRLYLEADVLYFKSARAKRRTRVP